MKTNKSLALYVSFVFSAGYKMPPKLNLVKISYKTPTFDILLKDEKANFETKMSQLGGTMGLMTGKMVDRKNERTG